MPKLIAPLALAASLLPFAAPALAKSGKAAVVRLPAALLKDPAARLCMPKTVMPAATKDMPSTVCQTQAEWAAAGVTIVAR